MTETPRLLQNQVREITLNEREQPIFQLRKDMLAAFKHGIEFELTQLNCDLNPETTSDKNLPFAEWFNKYYQKEHNNQNGRELEKRGKI